MNSADRLSLTLALEQSRSLLRAAVEGIEEPQWHEKVDGAWSVAEIMEHLWITEYGVSKVMIPRLLASPAVEGPGPTPDAVLVERTLDRGTKVMSPERVAPKDNTLARAKALERFQETRENLIAFVQSTGEDLRVHHGQHPVLGRMDCCQWILFIAAHTERHTEQIAQLKTR